MHLFKVLISACLCVCAFASASERSLKSNDSIQLIVFGEPSLGAVVTIDSSGSVNFPLIGNVEVVGKSATEVAKVVEERLEKDYIRDANVTVSVVSEFVPKEKPKPVVVKAPVKAAVAAKPVRGRVTVMGEVKAPGTVEFDGLRVDVLTIIAQVRGVTPLANPKKVIVRRVGENGGLFTLNLSDLQSSTQQFFLQSGDTVTVPKRLF